LLIIRHSPETKPVAIAFLALGLEVLMSGHVSLRDINPSGFLFFANCLTGQPDAEPDK
tara:strand:- start:394 stop:567 length:174 start_codon:yes stop_codon:yes gene_type:complete